MSNLRVLIIADDHFARGGLATILNAEDEITLVASQESDDDLHHAIATYRPDVILWDLGWEAAERVKSLEDYLGTSNQGQDGSADLPPILALIAEADECMLAREAGAGGILLRNAAPEKLIHSLHAVNLGLLVFDPDLEPHLFSPTSNPIEPLVEPLTPRELEILQRIAEGLTNRAIARKLDISDHTVKFHTTAIFGKLGVSSRTEAVVRATRAGLILL